MSLNCLGCRRPERCLFNELEPDLCRELTDVATTHKVGRGETISTPGAPVLAVSCVISGAAKLTRMGERGDMQILRLLGPSDVLGLRPILGDENFAATTTILDDCTLCVLPREAILHVLERSTRFAFRVMKYLAQQLDISEELLIALTQRPVRRRVADVLLLLHGHDIRGDKWEPLRVKRLKRKEMAQAIGATPETLSRVLAEFAKQGLISVNRRDIELLDVEGLQVVATDREKLI
ncbi:MAG: Crp/Fnr family transcriptional regulator [bacterium]|nr:Crp/Fnr family transcriptional regulator [bacterium]